MTVGIQVTFDATEPGKLAEFWALALGYQVQPPPPGFDSWEQFAERMGIPPEQWGDKSAVVDPAGEGPRVFFQRVPEEKAVKNRVHLDLNVSAGAADPEEGWRQVLAHVDTLVEAGATVLRELNEPTGRCVVWKVWSLPYVVRFRRESV